MRPRGRGRVREKWAQEKDRVRKTVEREKNGMHVRALKSHTNLLYLDTHTHTHKQGSILPTRGQR